MAKAPFAWDTESPLGDIKETEKVTTEVAICTLNGKTFVATTKKVLGAEGWKITKRQNFEIGLFEKIADLVQEAK